MQPAIEERLLRLPEVIHITGLSRATIYRRMGERTFPNRLQISPKIIAWKSSVIQAWISSNDCN